MKSSAALQNDTDVQLKKDVLSEFEYDPSIKASDIGVLVKDGTLTLNGFVENYWEKWAAVDAAKRVAGIKAIADEIEVRLPNSIHYTDSDIATAAETRIRWSPLIPEEAIKITVRQGRVILEGAFIINQRQQNYRYHRFNSRNHERCRKH